MGWGTAQRRTTNSAVFAICLLLVSLSSSAGQTSHWLATQEDADAKASKAFVDRVNAYVKVRKTLEDTLPPVKSSDQADKIVEHERLLAARIQEARKDAKRGDIFTGDIENIFRKRIREAF